jgi:hypothetical protein
LAAAARRGDAVGKTVEQSSALTTRHDGRATTRAEEVIDKIYFPNMRVAQTKLGMGVV